MLTICGIVSIIEVRINMDTRERETVEDLRKGRDAASSVFMEFSSLKQYYENTIFSFYEGEDAKYYNPRINEITGSNLIIFKANNKKNVLEVMHIIQSKQEYNKVSTMFFVDRDMDFDFEDYCNDDLYVTPCYSIENLYVSEKSLGHILADEFSFNVYEKNYTNTIALFRNYYEIFCNLIAEFNALVLIRSEKRLNCGKVNIQKIKTSQLIKIDIENGLSYGNHYRNEIDRLIEELNVTQDDIDKAKERLATHGDPCSVFRGKNQLDFFKAFIFQLSQQKNKIFDPVPTSVRINPNQNPLGDLSRFAETPSELIDFINRHCLHRTLSM